jgi:starch synthase
LDNKAKCKQALLEEKGLDRSENRLLVGLVGRLAEQKGIDIIVNALDRILNTGCNFILLGKGDARYQDMLKVVSGQQPDKISVNLAFDDLLAHRIYAASDVFLMPSRFEPCGLGQMISMAYGTAPIVNPVGGLADTVQNYDSNIKQGTGFAMTEATPDGLVDAIARAHMLWLNKPAWCKFQIVLMNQNFSWDSSSQKYLEIYRRKSLS